MQSLAQSSKKFSIHHLAVSSEIKPATVSFMTRNVFLAFPTQRSEMNLVSFMRHFTGCSKLFCVIFTQSADTVLPPFTFCHFTEIAHVVVCHHHKLTVRPAGMFRFHHLILLGKSQPFISRAIRASSVNRNDLWRHIGRILSGEVANFAENKNDFRFAPPSVMPATRRANLPRPGVARQLVQSTSGKPNEC